MQTRLSDDEALSCKSEGAKSQRARCCLKGHSYRSGPELSDKNKHREKGKGGITAANEIMKM